MAASCEQLRRRGFVIVRLPAEIIEAMDELCKKMRRFFALSNAEKNAFRTPQDGEVVLSHPAYLTPSPGWQELFEIRRSMRDPAYRFPPGCEAPCMNLFDLLRDHAMRSNAELHASACFAAASRGLPVTRLQQPQLITLTM